MQAAEFGLRYGSGTLPNVHFTVPRKSDVAWLAANGFTRNRLPIQWELLQPMLHDTPANATARAIIGEPGAFHAGYESYITGVLDAHAAAGIKCIIDLHNYCRYRDFVFQSNGSVIGLTASTDPIIRALHHGQRAGADAHLRAGAGRHAQAIQLHRLLDARGQQVEEPPGLRRLRPDERALPHAPARQPDRADGGRHRRPDDLAGLRAGRDQRDPRARSRQPDLPGRQRVERGDVARPPRTRRGRCKART